jgi:hypothetical protein
VFTWKSFQYAITLLTAIYERQKWLRERATVLLYTYITYLVSFKCFLFLVTLYICHVSTVLMCLTLTL